MFYVTIVLCADLLDLGQATTQQELDSGDKCVGVGVSSHCMPCLIKLFIQAKILLFFFFLLLDEILYHTYFETQKGKRWYAQFCS